MSKSLEHVVSRNGMISSTSFVGSSSPPISTPNSQVQKRLSLDHIALQATINTFTPGAASSASGRIDQNAPIQHTRSDDKAKLEARYDMGSKLGKGAFGTVRIVTDKVTREVFACKTIHKKGKGSAPLEQILREVDIMKRTRHPHVVQIREVYETPLKTFLVMEYCNGGELVKKVQRTNVISEQDVMLIIARLASVIGYLHDRNIVHRDIKPENILLSTQDPDDPYNIKVSDFGLAAYTGNGKLMENVCGTPLYMAPEVLAGLGYSQQCDIWSIGIMMGLLLAKYTKTAEKDLRDMITSNTLNINHPMWEDSSASARQLLERMLQVDPAQRITAKEILIHPWITGQKLESQNVLEMMKSYHAEQRWKTAFHVIVAAFRLRNGRLFDEKNSKGSNEGKPPRNSNAKASTGANRANTVSNSMSNRAGTSNASLSDFNGRVAALAATRGTPSRNRRESHPHSPASSQAAAHGSSASRSTSSPSLSPTSPGTPRDSDDCLATSLTAPLHNPPAVSQHNPRRSSLQGSKRRPLAPIATSTSSVGGLASPDASSPKSTRYRGQTPA